MQLLFPGLAPIFRLARGRITARHLRIASERQITDRGLRVTFTACSIELGTAYEVELAVIEIVAIVIVNHVLGTAVAHIGVKAPALEYGVNGCMPKLVRVVFPDSSAIVADTV